MPEEHEVKPDLRPGAIFWAKSEGQCQEEQGDHPWIILSVRKVADKNRIVVAVPMTSNATAYYDWDVYVKREYITPYLPARRKLKQEKMNGVVKCAKLRHWAVERIDEIVANCSAVWLNEIRGVVADVLGVPPGRP